MAGLIVVGIACGDAVSEMLDSGVPDAGAETPGDGSSMQYVGNSDETFDSRYSIDDPDSPGSRISGGFYVTYAACQKKFGPGHRTCTHDEILFTTNLPPQDDDREAWYGVGPAPTCSNDSRVTVDTAGLFGSERCGSTDLPIACCGPK